MIRRCVHRTGYCTARMHVHMVCRLGSCPKVKTSHVMTDLRVNIPKE